MLRLVGRQPGISGGGGTEWGWCPIRLGTWCPRWRPKAVVSTVDATTAGRAGAADTSPHSGIADESRAGDGRMSTVLETGTRPTRQLGARIVKSSPRMTAAA